MRFVAIDFETASQRPDSACQIGLVIVENGQIIQEMVRLIRPPSMYFSPRCIAVHGIHPSQVKDAPTWDLVWDEIQPVLENYPIIAHNAGFDLNVLCAAMSAYGLTCPYLEYSCTRLIARRTWPAWTSFALKSIANNLRYEFQHHDALEDSRACANIVFAAAQIAEVESFPQLEQKLSILRGRVQFGVKIAPKTRSIKRSKATADDPAARSATRMDLASSNKDSTDIASTVADAVVRACGDAKPLAGKSVVLAGRLLGLDRQTAVGFLEYLGAQVQTDINMQTSYVIVGTQNSASTQASSGHLLPAVLSERQALEIESRSAEGQPVRTITQRQLLALIPGGAAVARAGIG